MANKRIFPIVSIILLSFILTLQDIFFPLSHGINYRDGAIYQYIGHIMLQGKHPYVDAFDHKGIILYLINLFACSLNIRCGIWICDLLFMIGIISFSYLIARQFLPAYRSLIVFLLTYIDFQYSYWIGNTPDYFAVFFETVAFYLLIKFYNDIKNWKCLLGIGICIGFCFWLKQTTIIPVILLSFLVLVRISYVRIRLLLKRIFIIFVGFLMVSVLICTYHLETNTWGEMIRDYFLFNFGYSIGNTRGHVLTILLQYFQNSSTLIAFGICITYVIFAFSNKEKIMNNIFFVCGFIGLIMSMVFLAIPGRHYVQYFLICYPLMIIILSVSAGRVLDYLYIEIDRLGYKGNKYKKLIKYFIPLMLIISLIISTYNTCSGNWKRQEEYAEVIPIINFLCNQDDYIAIVSPHDCGLYLETGHESATTYPYVQVDRYNDEEMIEDYNRQIKTTLPKIIVWRKYWNYDSFFEDEIKSHYSLYRDLDLFKVYLRV